MLSRLLLCLFALSPSLFAAPPNIVIMLVDDMGVMDTSVPFLTDAEGKPKRYKLDREYRIRVPVTIPAGGRTWLTVESP